MTADISRYVRQCNTCALRKRVPHPQAPAKSWDAPAYPFQWTQCDFIGPLKTANQFKYILTFVDLKTGWPEAFPTKDQTAKTVADVFLSHIVCRYGRVERLHSDRGQSFLSKLLKEVTSRIGCRQSFTTGHMPTGNARVERLHRSLEDIIACYVDDDHTMWPDLIGLPTALWIIRSTISARTGFVPFTLMFGRDPQPMNIPLITEETHTVPMTDNTYFTDVLNRLRIMQQMASHVTSDYEEAMRTKLDKTARPANISVGDCVYLYDPRCAANQSSAPGTEDHIAS